LDRRAINAVTFITVKRQHLHRAEPDLHIVRCSVGSLGQAAVLPALPVFVNLAAVPGSGLAGALVALERH
jgi:hypothetical protein